MVSVKEMVVEILGRKNYTQKQLANALNVAESRVCCWLNGAKPHTKTLYKLQKLYNQSMEQTNENN